MTEFAWTHLLYRLYDADEQLLYIGRTNDLKHRFSRHAKVQPWWGDVARSAVETLPDLETLKAAEKAAIIEEKPLHNIVYNGRPLTDTDDCPVPAWLAISPRVTAAADVLHEDCRHRQAWRDDYDPDTDPPCRCCARQAIKLLTAADKAEGRVDEAMKAAADQVAHEESVEELAGPDDAAYSSMYANCCQCVECAPRWAARNQKRRELIAAATRPRPADA